VRGVQPARRSADLELGDRLRRNLHLQAFDACRARVAERQEIVHGIDRSDLQVGVIGDQCRKIGPQAMIERLGLQTRCLSAAR